jgi:UDP-GlcNAc:undecaprenyl-phosphate/decaprenyl-phosphate GlcNAc-1-phosphate transferase
MGPGPTLILALALGLAGGATGWRLTRDTFAAPLFQRTNVRGAQVPVAVGVLLPVVLVGAASLLILAETLDLLDLDDEALRTSLLAATGFGLLGLLDDLGGDATSKGFTGHLRALRRAQLTTGAVKLFGGAAVALLAASAASEGRVGRLLADAALIALAANLANLLDRAPGRVAKAALLAAVPIALVAGVDDRFVGPVVVLGATAALLVPDLRERLMLGDTGANVLGATLGLAVVMTAAPSTRSIVLLVVLALNLLSERVSFSRVIDRTPPLRAIDRLGRLPSG